MWVHARVCVLTTVLNFFLKFLACKKLTPLDDAIKKKQAKILHIGKRMINVMVTHVVIVNINAKYVSHSRLNLRSKVSSDWLPNYIKAVQPIQENRCIFSRQTSLC